MSNEKKPDDLTKTTDPADVELTEEESAGLSGGFLKWKIVEPDKYSPLKKTI